MSKKKKKKLKIESGTHPHFTNILESFANAMTIGTKPKGDERRTIQNVCRQCPREVWTKQGADVRQDKTTRVRGCKADVIPAM